MSGGFGFVQNGLRDSEPIPSIVLGYSPARGLSNGRGKEAVGLDAKDLQNQTVEDEYDKPP